ASVCFGEMRISHGHADGFVAEKLLHGANVHSGHDEATSERVPQAVPAKTRNLRILEGGLKPAPRLSCAAAGEFRGRVQPPESFERLNGCLIQWDVPNSTVLAARDRENATWEGHILPEQAVLLAQAKAGVKRKVKFRNPLRELCFDSAAQDCLFGSRK